VFQTNALEDLRYTFIKMNYKTKETKNKKKKKKNKKKTKRKTRRKTKRKTIKGKT
jgi:hypothetical protein